jgi:hypothetical protein
MIKRDSEQPLVQSERSTIVSRKTLAAGAWGDWWKDKKKSNDDFLAAA